MIPYQVEEARFFALKHHGNQKYGEFSYEFHLLKVVEVVDRFAARVDVGILDLSAMRGIAWLHDVLEDTHATLADVLIEFGPDIAIQVFAVTNESGPNRMARLKKTIPKVVAAGYYAAVVKLADRIANIEWSIATDDHARIEMYRSEHETLMAEQYGEDGDSRTDAMLQDMRRHLCKLLEPIA